MGKRNIIQQIAQVIPFSVIGVIACCLGVLLVVFSLATSKMGGLLIVGIVLAVIGSATAWFFGKVPS